MAATNVALALVITASILKVAGWIDIKWRWVFAPLWGPVLAVVLILAIYWIAL